jgi:soluble lytic murein transglycosylase-like protein
MLATMNQLKSALDKWLIIVLLIFLILVVSSKPYEYLIILPVTSPIYQTYREEERESLPPRRDVPAEYRVIFAAASGDYGIPPGVLESIAMTESSFRPDVLSPPRRDGTRDRGMFQFNDRYLQWYADQYNCGAAFDPMVPAEAITIAARHIQWLHSRYRHWPDVVMAYNAGFHAVDTGEIPDRVWDYLIKIYTE